ncbi:hypothetical protein C7972_10127 [Arenibacter sp. ARW7G5Y1]|nr:hypothetical protein C7972_10127 [Arenibacter sp. ARW7G5Y1]
MYTLLSTWTIFQVSGTIVLGFARNCTSDFKLLGFKSLGNKTY